MQLLTVELAFDNTNISVTGVSKAAAADTVAAPPSTANRKIANRKTIENDCLGPPGSWFSDPLHVLVRRSEKHPLF